MRSPKPSAKRLPTIIVSLTSIIVWLLLWTLIIDKQGAALSQVEPSDETLIFHEDFDNDYSDYAPGMANAIDDKGLYVIPYGIYTHTNGQIDNAILISDTMQSRSLGTRFDFARQGVEKYLAPSKFTISLWVRTPVTQTTQMRLLHHGYHGEAATAESFPYPDYALDYYGNNAYAAFFSFGSCDSPPWVRVPFVLVGNPVDIPPNSWTHVTFTWADHHVQIFVNGNLNVEGNVDPNLVFTPCHYELIVGKNNWPNPMQFIGALDDLRLYNRVLDAAEINQLYEQNKIPVTNTPTFTPTPTPTPTPTFTNTPTPTLTDTPWIAYLPSVNLQPTYTPTPTLTSTPTSTPTATTIPTATIIPEGIRILHTHNAIGGTGRTHIYGEVLNNTDEPIAGVEISASAYDSQNTFIGAADTSTFYTNLPPSKKVCFTIVLENLPIAVSSYRFDSVISTISDDYRSANFAFVNLNRYRQPDKSYRIVGQIRNDTGDFRDYVTVAVTGYDAQGKVIGCSLVFAETSSLLPGQISSFDIVLNTSKRDMAGFEVIASGVP